MNAEDIKKQITKKIYDFGVTCRTEDIDINKMLLKAFNVCSEILNMVQVAADNMAMKSTGECDICFGKGYLKEYRVKKIKDEEGKEVETTKIVHGFCKCDRGRALKKLVLSNIIWVDAYEKNNS
jgi:hypothetical protein